MRAVRDHGVSRLVDETIPEARRAYLGGEPVAERTAG
jgi:hypothetical protein